MSATDTTTTRKRGHLRFAGFNRFSVNWPAVAWIASVGGLTTTLHLIGVI